MLKPFLEAGEFVTTHGIHGEIKLYPWSDDASFLTQFHNLYLTKQGENCCKVQSMRIHKNTCLVKLNDVDTVEQARIYIGKTVFIARAEANLAEGRHFVQDIIGAKVKDVDTGEVYGTIQDITAPGRHDVYKIAAEDGEVFYFPATEPFLISIDIEGEEVLVKPIAGMFEREIPKPAKPKRKKSKKPASDELALEGEVE